MPITITPTTVINEASNNYSNSRIKVSLPGGFYQYTMGNSYPTSHALQVRFPLFDQEQEFNQLSNWKFKANIISGGGFSISWLNFGGNSWNFTINESLGTPSGTEYVKNLLFHFNWLNQLQPGQYNMYCSLKVTATNSFGTEIVVAERAYPISLLVTAAQESFFYVTYFESDINALAFTYRIGGGAFPSQSIFAYTNESFTVQLSNTSMLSATMVTLSGYKRIDIGYVAPPEQPIVGVIEEYLTIMPNNPDLDDIIVPIKIYVHTTGIQPYLSIAPEVLNFTLVRGAPLPEPQVVSLLSSAVWTLTTELPSWLHVNQVSGAGSDTLIVKITDEGLSLGSLQYQLEFTNQYNTVIVPVNLSVVNFLTSPFFVGHGLITAPLYFTQDLDWMDFSSPEQNTYVSINLSIKMFKLRSYDPVIYEREYELPMYEEKGRFHLGSVVHQLFEEFETLDQGITELEYNHFLTQYKPAEIFVSCALRNIDDDSIIRGATITKILMIKGHSPFMSGRFGLLNQVQQEFTRITSNSVLNCNFSSSGPIDITVRKNGVTFEQFSIVNPTANGKILYSYFRFNENVIPGDTIEVSVGKNNVNRTRRFLVIPPGKESTHFFFENEFGLLEAVEFTGRRKLNSGYSHTTKIRYDDLFERNEKVKSVNKQKLNVNTGYLLPGDHRVIDALIKSNNIWCAFDDPSGNYFKVDAITDKLVNADTDNSVTSFDVEFNILENADVTIRLQ